MRYLLGKCTRGLQMEVPNSREGNERHDTLVFPFAYDAIFLIFRPKALQDLSVHL